MGSHEISLPKSISDYVDARLAEGEYDSLSDYVAALLLREQTERTAAAGELRSLLDDADASGVSENSLDTIFINIRSSAAKP